jgi:hypothetical protein
MTETTELGEREAFEAWWTRDKSGDEQRARIDLMRENIDHEGEYSLLRMQTAWESWQARAALATAPEQAGEPIYQVRMKGSLKWQDLEQISFDMYTDEERYARRIVYTAPPPASTNNIDWRDICAALVDIYDDAMNNAPEDRCYVDGAWKEELDKARAIIAATEGK